MGLCHDEHGGVSIETRRESFTIHADYEWWGSDYVHPEFPYEDLDNMIAALQEIRDIAGVALATKG